MEQGGTGFHLRDVGVLEISGAEAQDFLQRMLTQDVASLRPGRYAPACLTDRLAKMVGSMELLALPQGFLTLSDAGCSETLSKALKKYILGSKVTLVDRSAEFSCLGLHGLGAKKQLAELGVAFPEDLEQTHGEATLWELPVRWIQSTRLGLPGFQLLVPSSHRTSLTSYLRESGALELSGETVTGLRVETGTAVFGVDYAEDAMPIEVGLEKAVSYSKGCYVGQEILERLRSRKKRPRLLSCLSLSEPPPAASPLTVTRETSSLGTLTSLSPSPRGDDYVGLVRLPANEIDRGEAMQVAGLEAQIKEFV
jgi:folate-binding protein YgfZ